MKEGRHLPKNVGQAPAPTKSKTEEESIESLKDKITIDTAPEVTKEEIRELKKTTKKLIPGSKEWKEEVRKLRQDSEKDKKIKEVKEKIGSGFSRMTKDEISNLKKVENGE